MEMMGITVDIQDLVNILHKVIVEYVKNYLCFSKNWSIGTCATYEDCSNILYLNVASGRILICRGTNPRC